MSDYTWHSLSGERTVPAAAAANDAAANAAAANAAANAAAASFYGLTTADTKTANTLYYEKIQQQINSFACPDCKRLASLTQDINTRCLKCKQKPQGGYKRKSKSQRRKKSKSQRRRKSIKRRH